MKRAYNAGCLLFDLDGTLYPSDADSFLATRVHAQVVERSIEFLVRHVELTEDDARSRFASIQGRFPRLYSVGLQEEFGINRERYLEFAWNIGPEGLIQPYVGLQQMLESLPARRFVVSDAPSVWIGNVVAYLCIEGCFEACFSGTSLKQKKVDGLFRHAMQAIGTVNGGDCIVIGDEREIDIIPASKEGMATVYVGCGPCPEADYRIANVMEVPSVLGMD